MPYIPETAHFPLMISTLTNPSTDPTHTPNGIQIQLAVFPQYTHQTDKPDRQTDRQTDRQMV